MPLFLKCSGNGKECHDWFSFCCCGQLDPSSTFTVSTSVFFAADLVQTCWMLFLRFDWLLSGPDWSKKIPRSLQYLKLCCCIHNVTEMCCFPRAPSRV